jgi:hypothetical protein
VVGPASRRHHEAAAISSGRRDIESLLLPENQETSPVVAHLAPDISAEIRRREHGTSATSTAASVPATGVVVTAVKVDYFCGLSFQTCFIIAAIGILLALGSIIGVIVVLSMQGGGGQPDDTSQAGVLVSLNPTPSPTDAHSLSPSPAVSPSRNVFSPRFEFIYDRIGAAVTTTPQEILRNTETNQHRAMAWLADGDEAYDELNDLTTQMLIERYVMALLYFETNGDTTWNLDFNFLSPVSTCEWNHILQGGRKKQGAICDGSSIAQVDLRTYKKILRNFGLSNGGALNLKLLLSIVSLS